MNSKRFGETLKYVPLNKIVRMKSLKGKNVRVKCTDGMYSGTLEGFDEEALILSTDTRMAIPWNSVLYISYGEFQYNDKELHRRHIREAMIWLGLYALVVGVGTTVWLLLRWYL